MPAGDGPSVWPTSSLGSDVVGRPTRKAATAALNAHLSVGKGKPIRLSVSEALADAKGLGGQERRFVAVCARELSRHQRLLDLAAKRVGLAPGDLRLPEDRALVRYTLWRRLFTGASWPQLRAEVQLPGPIRPRTLRDDALELAATKPLPEEEIEDDTERAATRHSFPNWLAQALAQQVPEGEVDALFAALNAEPDLFLRARPPGTREARMDELRAEGVASEPVEWAADAIRLTEHGMKVFDTSAMRGGRLQVQEPGSQLIAEVCRVQGAQRAADVCAGAAGKTIALADLLGEGARIFASDASKRRLDEGRRRVRELKVKNVTFTDAAPLGEVDVVLVDAPCSGTGSLAREPEQKWRLTKEKIAEFAQTQRKILEDVARPLRAGAVLVYATCSLLREEDEAVVEAFVAAHPEFEVEPCAAAPEVMSGPFVRVLPHRARSGGFFAARMRKRG